MKDDDDLIYDYRETQPFLDYCDLIESHLTDEPQTYRALKAKLGDGLIIHWFVEALEKLESDARAKYNRGAVVDTVQKGDGVVNTYTHDKGIAIWSSKKDRPDLGLD